MMLFLKAEYLYTTAGVHPTRSQELANGGQEYYESLLSHIQSNRSIIAIGECGLDYDRLHFSPANVQKQVFPMHFQLAKETRLPMFFHNRNSKGDFIELVTKHRADFGHGCVHSFTDGLDELRACLDLGLYIGVNGWYAMNHVPGYRK